MENCDSVGPDIFLQVGISTGGSVIRPIHRLNDIILPCRCSEESLYAANSELHDFEINVWGVKTRVDERRCEGVRGIKHYGTTCRRYFVNCRVRRFTRTHETRATRQLWGCWRSSRRVGWRLIQEQHHSKVIRTTLLIENSSRAYTEYYLIVCCMITSRWVLDVSPKIICDSQESQLIRERRDQRARMRNHPFLKLFFTKCRVSFSGLEGITCVYICKPHIQNKWMVREITTNRRIINKGWDLQRGQQVPITNAWELEELRSVHWSCGQNQFFLSLHSVVLVWCMFTKQMRKIKQHRPVFPASTNSTPRICGLPSCDVPVLSTLVTLAFTRTFKFLREMNCGPKYEVAELLLLPPLIVDWLQPERS